MITINPGLFSFTRIRRHRSRQLQDRTFKNSVINLENTGIFWYYAKFLFKKIHEAPCQELLSIAPAKPPVSIYSLDPDMVSRPDSRHDDPSARQVLRNLGSPHGRHSGYPRSRHHADSATDDAPADHDCRQSIEQTIPIRLWIPVGLGR